MHIVRIMILNIIFFILIGVALADRPNFVLADDGHAVVTIVIAENATHAALFAAQELQLHIEKITGVQVPISTDAESVQGSRILVGQSVATDALKVDVNNFADQEYMIKFSGDTLILLGRDDTERPKDMTLHRNIIWTQGRFGGALDFNGNDTGLAVAHSGFSDKECTIGAWVWFPSKVPKVTQVLLRLDGRRGYNILQRPSGTKSLQLANKSGKQYSEITSKPLTEGWHHIAAVYSLADGIMELFVDGVSNGTAVYRDAKCAGANLSIGGGVMAKYEHVGNPFLGKIDEVCISSIRRVPNPSDITARPKLDASTVLLMHFDEGTGLPRSSVARYQPPPLWYHAQATSYAVHDFLENFCGVRWFGPTDLLMEYPSTNRLSVSSRNVRRAPAFKLRCGGPRQSLARIQILWNQASGEELRLYWARRRLGGEPVSGNHSFYGYYDRFWKKNPAYSAYFVKHEPKWFAQVATDPPPQMCYTSTGFVAQVVEDARHFFDTGKLPLKSQALGDYFSLCPQDNNQYCTCPACLAEMNDDQRKNPQFSNGYSSDYIFTFNNRVATELAKTHPDRFVSTLAYWDYAYHPQRVKVLPNISVMMCLHIRNWWAPSMEASDMKVYRSWVDNEKGRRLFLWLYYCFPELNARSGGFHCFPGYFAHTQAKLIKMFARDGIRGLHPGGGSGWLVDSYVMHKLIDDPTLDVDDLLENLFSSLYGEASEPMKKMYLRIESIYSDTKNYPKDVQTENKTFHQNEDIAWTWLGTAERMAELGKLMEEAESVAVTSVQKQRILLFREGVWEYMVEGRRKYLAKSAKNPERNKLMALPPPSCIVPLLSEVGGDVAKVDWTKAVLLEPWYTLDGYVSDRNLKTRLAHDGTYLYVQCEENLGFLNPRKLVSVPGIWRGDDWEIIFAQARSTPFFQLGIAPSGKFKKHIAGATTWSCAPNILSDISAPDRWTVNMSIKLKQLVPGGVKPGQSFYGNFGRHYHDGGFDAWSPNFVMTFHVPKRFGELMLEEK